MALYVIKHRSLPITVHASVFEGGAKVSGGFDVVGEFTMQEHQSQAHIRHARKVVLDRLSDRPETDFLLEERAPCSDELKRLVKAYVSDRFDRHCAFVTKVVRNPLLSYGGWHENQLTLGEREFPLLWKIRGTNDNAELIFATENPIWEREAILMSLKNFVSRPKRFASLHTQSKKRVLRARAQDLERLLNRSIDIQNVNSGFEDMQGFTKLAIDQFNAEVASV